MFERVGLQTNLGNMKAMVCNPGFIWGKQGNVVDKRIVMEEGDMFRGSKRTRVILEEYRKTMASSLLPYHMKICCGRFMKHTRGVDIGGGGNG